MIKLFHKIRQQLLSQNRIGRYLLYAVGEIILVVMGILIADFSSIIGMQTVLSKIILRDTMNGS